MKLVKNGRGVYVAVFRTAEGKRAQLSTRQTNFEAARKVAADAKIAELEQAAQLGCLTYQAVGLILSGRKITCAEALVQWKEWQDTIGNAPRTIFNHTQYLEAWMKEAHTGGLSPGAVTPKHIDPWVNGEGEAKAATRNVKLAALRSFFDLCAARGWCHLNPAKEIRVKMSRLSFEQKEPSPRIPFTDVEVKKLLETTIPGSFWHCATAIARYTGLRLGDICTLEWDCLAKPDTIVVWTDKRDRRVELPLRPAALLKAIQGVPIQDKRWLFPVQREILSDMKRRSLLSVQFTRLCEQQGILGKSFHCLRVSYATECAREGIPTPHIARNLGHASVGTTLKHYVKG